jgi:hypothetical protein
VDAMKKIFKPVPAAELDRQHRSQRKRRRNARVIPPR